MELKFLCACSITIETNCSNRTFMELKYEVDELIDEEDEVLIVPLWN